MKFFLFCLFFSLSMFVNAESLKNKNFGKVIVSEVTSIYDGDTFRANLAAGWPKIISYRIGIRIGGIDTPELKSKCQVEKVKARLAKQFTVENLRKAKKIELRNMRRGKYFRIVADVWLDGKNLAEALLKAGHAVKYDGGTKTKDWCKQQFTDVLKINAGGGCVNRQLTGFRIRVGNKVGIVTALHGVVGCNKITVKGHYKELKIYQADIERDVAFLYSDELKGSLSQLQTGKKFPTRGENLHVIGYPHGMSTQLHSKKLEVRHSPLEKLKNLIPHGKFFSKIKKRNSPNLNFEVLNIEGHLVHGHSGAPIFNRDNEVVGIANGGLNNGYAEIVWAIPWLNLNWQKYSQIRREELEKLSKNSSPLLSSSPLYCYVNNFGGGVNLEKLREEINEISPIEDPYTYGKYKVVNKWKINLPEDSISCEGSKLIFKSGDKYNFKGESYRNGKNLTLFNSKIDFSYDIRTKQVEVQNYKLQLEKVKKDNDIFYNLSYDIINTVIQNNVNLGEYRKRAEINILEIIVDLHEKGKVIFDLK